jgi:MSHA biogenesis protein MshQ
MSNCIRPSGAVEPLQMLGKDVCQGIRRMRRWAFMVWLAFFSTLGIAAIAVSGSNSATTGATATTSLTITPVAAAARADLLLVQLTLADATATITPPTGWTEITTITQSATGIQQRVYWKIRSNSEPASYTWSFSKSARGALILLDLNGVDTNQAINASSGQFGSGTTIYAPEVAAAYANGMIVGFFGSTGVGSAITPQASMTTVAQTNAVSGSTGVQLALAYEQVASDGLTGLRTATGASGTYAGQTIAITPAPAAICFTDNFNRTSLGSDWVTSNSKGGFNPIINKTGANQRLELTQNAGNQATLAILQRFFPAAGNNVVVSFKQYAYPNGGGTSGADGIVTIFSDALVAPVAGGSGGSMGYAQYSSPANTPGFAGGWLGVGIDEYGNFSSPSEDRYLGPGARINSIAIRGPSNSFYANGVGSTYAQGYPYVAGSASLTPILGSTTSVAAGGGRGDIYRITIDSRVPREQWVQVERSTDGGANYTAHVPFFNLMTSLQSLAGWGAVTLPSIPANFWLSFSGGTGGSQNIHEIDDLQVCATKMIAATAAIDHFRFENPSTMNSCQPTTIKVTACTDAAPNCTQFAGDVYVTLKPTGWVGGDTVKLIGGKGTLQLAQGSTGTVTLDIDKTKTIWPALKSPSTYASECVVPGSSTATSCNLTVTAASAGFGVTFPSASFAACDDSGDVMIKACSSGYAGASKNLQLWFGYTDPATTVDASRVLQLSKDAWATSTNLAASSPASSSSPTPISVTFDGNATVKVRVKYPDVGKLTLNVRDSAATSIVGSATVIVRPSTFVATATDMSSPTPVSNPAAADATGAKFVAAGMPFKVTVEARNNCATPSVVKNFGRESTAENVKLDQALATGPGQTDNLGLTDNPPLATVSDFSFANGAGTATLTWPEVGIIKLTPRLKSGSYMGTVDVLGAQSGNVGRFYAHHLDTVVNTQGCSSFTYDRQPIAQLTISAKANGGGASLVNYRGSSTSTISFAKAVTLTDNTGKGTVSIGGASVVPVLAFGSGSAILNGADANHPLVTFAFTTNPSAPATIGLVATDADNSGFAGAVGAANIRSGRVRMMNAYGSELLDLPLSMKSEYWGGGSWQLNAADTCTDATLSFAAVGADITGKTCVLEPGNNSGKGCAAALSASQTNRKYLETLVSGTDSNGTAGFAGNFNLWLKAPGTGNQGALDVTATVPAWLQFNWTGAVGNPKARATFGVFKSPVIYRRENY